ILVAHVTDGFFSKANGQDLTVLPQALEPNSLIAVPILHRGRILGDITFARSDSYRPFGKEDIEMGQELARRIAQTFENARLHHRLKRAMRQRLERDRYLKLTFRKFPGSVWTVDRNLRFTYATGRLIQELKHPRMGSSLYEFLGTTDPTNPSIAHHLAALSGERQSFQYEFGNRFYAVLLEPLPDHQEQVLGCLAVAFDVP